MNNSLVDATWTYHNGTKHSDQSVRTSAHVLDWPNQPLPFKVYSTLDLHTNTVTGEIELDTDNILQQPSVGLSVPVDSLDTGIPLMNEVLRSGRWLDGSKFPEIRFTLGKVLSPTTPTALKDGAPTAVKAEGTFEFHGRSKVYPIQGEITWFRANEKTARRLPGDLLHFRAQFDVHLPDYGIESHLSAQSLDKVSGRLEVDLDLFASTQRTEIPGKMIQELARARRELGERMSRS